MPRHAFVGNVIEEEDEEEEEEQEAEDNERMAVTLSSDEEEVSTKALDDTVGNESEAQERALVVRKMRQGHSRSCVPFMERFGKCRGTDHARNDALFRVFHAK